MMPRNMLAYAILIVGSGAAFYCYSCVSPLLPMEDPTLVEKTEAWITEVTTPMVKTGQGANDVAHEVGFAFTVDGTTIEGSYSVKERNEVPKKGDAVPVAYRIDRPEIFLRTTEYEGLSHELLGLRIMMWVFALGAMVLPFFVMNHKA